MSLPDEEDKLPSHLDADIIQKRFLLSSEDINEVRRCRGAILRLCYAIQLCVLRWRGHFLKDVREAPWPVFEYVAQQLGMLAISWTDFVYDEQTRQDQMQRLRRYLGFARCGPDQRQQLLDYLVECVPRSAKTSVLRETAVEWLRQDKIVRPRPSTLIDIIQAARERGLQRLYELLTDSLSGEQRQKLEDLLLPKDEATRQALEQFKAPARQESPEALQELIERLKVIQSLGLADLPQLVRLHPAAQRLLGTWGYRYDIWNMRRFPTPKRLAILLCFVRMARAEITDSLVEMQDKLITRQHMKARQRRDQLLQSTEQARTQAIEAFETVGTLVADESVPDGQLRPRIFAQLSREHIQTLVAGCRQMRLGGNTSYLAFLEPSYNYTRKYSPPLLESIPFVFAENAPLQPAVEHLREINRANKRKLSPEAPVTFVTRRWKPYVHPEEGKISRPYYELATLTLLNEHLKSGDVTVAGSRRWTDFEDYLIPKATWEAERSQHYSQLSLPLDVDVFLDQLGQYLDEVTQRVEKRVTCNGALTIDAEKGTFRLTAFKGEQPPASVKELKNLLEIRIPRIDLVDLLIDMDNETDFLRHFLHVGGELSRLSPAHLRRNVLAALIATGCNIGPQRMAVASPGIGVWEINQIADFYFTEEALKAASIDLVNHATRLPLARVWGQGDACSSDGMRFYVPVNVLAADYSGVLKEHGVTMLAHTANNYLQMHQKPIPCRLRESTFSLDGLMEHETELDPQVCYTDTHGYTEVVMATASLLGFDLAPRIRDVKDQTLYKMDRTKKYAHLDPLLTGTIRPERIRQSWDEAVRVIASIKARNVSPSLILHRLGSYARRNSIHQALCEIGRVYKTAFILTYLDDEPLRRRMGRELNKGEGSHELSRFLCFGKEGALRGRDFEDQVHTFSCLSLLHNAVVGWNIHQMGLLIEQLRQEGRTISDEDIQRVAPLMWRHINPFGQYHFDLTRMRRVP